MSRAKRATRPTRPMRPMRPLGSTPWILPLSGLALLALAALAPAGVQGAPSRKDESFFEAIDVDVMSVEVYVTDRAGKPVAGLTQADFEVYEDGRKMEVTNFYAEEEVAPPAAEAGAEPVPAVQQQRGVPTEDQRLYLGVFVDNRSLEAQARNRAISSMKEFLGQKLRPEDRILLASYDGGMQIRQGPTNDPAALNAALEEVAKGSPYGNARRADFNQILREMQLASLPPPPGAMVQDSSREEADAVYAGLRLFAQRRNDEVRGTLHALEQFVSSLSGLPGRKAVLFVSGGLPLRPADALYQAMQIKYIAYPELNKANALESLTFDATSDFRKLLARANTDRVTFYSLAAINDVGTASAYTRIWTPDLVASERFSQVGPLSDLAGATGGIAALDPVSPGPLLAQMHRDLSTFYSIGYISPDKRSGKTHKLKVKVLRPGLEARHRENYLSKTGDERTEDRTTAALLLGETKNSLGVAVALGAESRNKEGQIELEVTIKFPISNLVLLPSEHFHEGRVSVFIGSKDSHGRQSKITQIAIPIRIPNEQLMTVLGQTAGYSTKLLLRPEPHQVAVGVRDEVGNSDSTVLADFDPEGGAGARSAAVGR